MNAISILCWVFGMSGVIWGWSNLRLLRRAIGLCKEIAASRDAYREERDHLAALLAEHQAVTRSGCAACTSDRATVGEAVQS